MKAFTFTLIMALGLSAFGNTVSSPDTPLSHCYHWLDGQKGFLQEKYNYAKQNGSELSFYTTVGTSNGAKEGPGLYCAKSPSGSHSYGNRAIRIQFVKNVVVFDAIENRQYCGLDGKFYANQQDCENKEWDVKLFQKDPTWYVIRNPRAVESWTTNDDTLVSEIKADGPSPSQPYYREKIEYVLQLINEERAKLGVLDFVNEKRRMENEAPTTIAVDLPSPAIMPVAVAAVTPAPNVPPRSYPLLTLYDISRDLEGKISNAELAKKFAMPAAEVIRDKYISMGNVLGFCKPGSLMYSSLVAAVKRQIPSMKKKGDLYNLEIVLGLMIQNQKQFTLAEWTIVIKEGLILNNSDVSFLTFGDAIDPKIKKLATKLSEHYRQYMDFN